MLKGLGFAPLGWRCGILTRLNASSREVARNNVKVGKQAAKT